MWVAVFEINHTNANEINCSKLLSKLVWELVWKLILTMCLPLDVVIDVKTCAKVVVTIHMPYKNTCIHIVFDLFTCMLGIIL